MMMLRQSALDAPDKIERFWHGIHASVFADLEGIAEEDQLPRLLGRCDASSEGYEQVVVALFYQLIADTTDHHNQHDARKSEKAFANIVEVDRDHFAILARNCGFIIKEKFPVLTDHAQIQVFWLLGRLIELNLDATRDIFLLALRQLVPMLPRPHGRLLGLRLIKVFAANVVWLCENDLFCQCSVFWLLRAIADLYPIEQNAKLLESMVSLAVFILESRFDACMLAGRDLVRALQDVARVDAFQNIIRSLHSAPDTLCHGFAGVRSLLRTSTPSKVLAMRFSPRMETEYRFLLTKAFSGKRTRHFGWFEARYLGEEHRDSLIPDMIRFTCNNYHPSNKALASRMIKRFEVIFWLLPLCKTSVGAQNAKLALLFDGLVYGASDNIMNIEPCILLLAHCASAHPLHFATLLEFITLLPGCYFPPLEHELVLGFTTMVKDALAKGVVSDISKLLPASMDTELRQQFFGTFPELSELSASLASKKANQAALELAMELEKDASPPPRVSVAASSDPRRLKGIMKPAEAQADRQGKQAQRLPPQIGTPQLPKVEQNVGEKAYNGPALGTNGQHHDATHHRSQGPRAENPPLSFEGTRDGGCQATAERELDVASTTPSLAELLEDAEAILAQANEEAESEKKEHAPGTQTSMKRQEKGAVPANATSSEADDDISSSSTRDVLFTRNRATTPTPQSVLSIAEGEDDDEDSGNGTEDAYDISSAGRMRFSEGTMAFFDGILEQLETVPTDGYQQQFDRVFSQLESVSQRRILDIDVFASTLANALSPFFSLCVYENILTESLTYEDVGSWPVLTHIKPLPSPFLPLLRRLMEHLDDESELGRVSTLLLSHLVERVPEIDADIVCLSLAEWLGSQTLQRERPTFRCLQGLSRLKELIFAHPKTLPFWSELADHHFERLLFLAPCLLLSQRGVDKSGSQTSNAEKRSQNNTARQQSAIILSAQLHQDPLTRVLQVIDRIALRHRDTGSLALLHLTQALPDFVHHGNFQCTLRLFSTPFYGPFCAAPLAQAVLCGALQPLLTAACSAKIFQTAPVVVGAGQHKDDNDAKAKQLLLKQGEGIAVPLKGRPKPKCSGEIQLGVKRLWELVGLVESFSRTANRKRGGAEEDPSIETEKKSMQRVKAAPVSACARKHPPSPSPASSYGGRWIDEGDMSSLEAKLFQPDLLHLLNHFRVESTLVGQPYAMEMLRQLPQDAAEASVHSITQLLLSYPLTAELFDDVLMSELPTISKDTIMISWTAKAPKQLVDILKHLFSSLDAEYNLHDSLNRIRPINGFCARALKAPSIIQSILMQLLSAVSTKKLVVAFFNKAPPLYRKQFHPLLCMASITK